MSGTYGGIQAPLKSGLPLYSRGAGPAGASGRVEAPDEGGPWAALNETLAASVSSIAAAIAEQNSAANAAELTLGGGRLVDAFKI